MRLAVFVLFVVAVSSLIPYADVHAPDGAVVRHAESYQQPIHTDCADAYPGNSTVLNSENQSGDACTGTGQLRSLPGDTLQSWLYAERGSSAPPGETWICPGCVQGYPFR